MATIINPQISSVSPATGTEAAPPISTGNPGTGSEIGNLPAPDLRKFNALTSSRSPVSRSILGRSVGNVAEINAGGVRGTPNDLVEKVLEHEPPLGLLDAALR
ncbi:MAG TPA: hypothetical protein VJR29_03805 [bacterium]|nr:hypothetical protein [bacterium]